MRINRIILWLFMIASGIFASFYGGNVSYAFFYLMLAIPVCAFLYTVYVYISFRLYQEIGQRTMVKGDFIPYSFTIANENNVTFRSVKVNFFHDRSTISHAKSFQEYCLLPNMKETMETKICGNYRGQYYVGANTIEIMDFFYLFRINYPISTKLKVTVLPRVVEIERLGIAPTQKDAKVTPYLLKTTEETMDIETRKYQSGDSRKQIHWKATAKRNELFSRKYCSNPREGIAIIMDLQPVGEDDLTITIVEDQIIEATLSVANYCRNNNTRVKVYFEQEGYHNISVNGKIDFDLFYNLCATIHFNSTMTAEELLRESHHDNDNPNFYIIVTHILTKELNRAILQMLDEGYDLALLLMKDNLQPAEDEILQQLKSAGIIIRIITREDEVGEVLNS